MLNFWHEQQLQGMKMGLCGPALSQKLAYNYCKFGFLSAGYQLTTINSSIHQLMLIKFLKVITLYYNYTV